MATAARNTFFILGVREWDDGMHMQGSATFERHDADDGSMVLTFEDETGANACYVLAPELAESIRQMHELIFCGCGLMERAAGAMMAVMWSLSLM